MANSFPSFKAIRHRASVVNSAHPVRFDVVFTSSRGLAETQSDPWKPAPSNKEPLQTARIKAPHKMLLAAVSG